MADLVALEFWLRGGAFVALLAGLLAWETAWPWRGWVIPRLRHALDNLLLTAIGTLVLRVAFPVLAVGFAARMETAGIGLFNAVALPAWIEIVLAVLALDLAIYLQHRAFHAMPLLWRLHKVHHADLDLDVTSGLRFHPIEFVLSMLIKFAAIAALGAAPFAVLIFELLLGGLSMFNHANIRIPAGVERVLRLLVVTPDMHRVHHSVVRRETDSNFGFNMPWWDRLLGTYRPGPAAGYQGMTIGLPEYPERRPHSLWWMLALPFARSGGGPRLAA
jgi:sterol desaturase/sphingolipid hydroxylase (fatty acid hydroxylase superfamily)